MVLRKVYTMYNDSAAGNGEWIPLDYRFEQENERTIAGKVVSGDTIQFQGTHVKASDKNDLASVITSEDIHDLGDAFTEDFTDILNGQWTYVRVVKTGTNGNAKVTAVL